MQDQLKNAVQEAAKKHGLTQENVDQAMSSDGSSGPVGAPGDRIKNFLAFLAEIWPLIKPFLPFEKEPIGKHGGNAPKG